MPRQEAERISSVVGSGLTCSENGASGIVVSISIERSFGMYSFIKWFEWYTVNTFSRASMMVIKTAGAKLPAVPDIAATNVISTSSVR